MPFDARDWLRTVVLKTNGIWPLRQCNRVPYAAALRLFVRVFERCPEIASIYLSHGLAGNDWIPGLSDIDLTVILENALPADAEYAFLLRFWHTCDRLKRYFPMLGEVVILSEGEFGLWQTYASTTTHGRLWVLLHGRETTKKVCIDAAVWRKRALNAALWVYLESLPPCLAQSSSYLRRHDVARRARKILRYLDPIVPGSPRPDGDSAEAIACILKALEAAAITVSGVTSPVPIGNGNGIRGVVSTDAGQVLVVLEDRLDTGVLTRLVRVHLPGEPLLPHSLFAYMICHYTPNLHARLQSGRTVVCGGDPFPGIRPPGSLEFRARMLDRIAYLLPMTRGEELLSTRNPLPLAVLENAVTDGLAVHLLLRDDWVAPNRCALEAACRSNFPEFYRELDSVREYFAAGNEAEARCVWFRLFRPIADGILEFARRRDSALMQN